MLRATCWVVGHEGNIGPRCVIELPVEDALEFKERAVRKVMEKLTLGTGYTYEFGPIGAPWQRG